MMLLRYFFVLMSLDDGLSIALDLFKLVALDDEMIITDLFIGFVAAYEHATIILNANVHVLFCMDEYLFFTFCVVEAPFIKSFSTFGAVRFDAGDFIVLRMFRVGSFAKIRWHLIGIVDTADDDRLVRVPFEKIHYDLMTDAWPKRSAPAFAGPLLCYPHPARTVRVVFAFSIPVKLDLHAA